MKLQQGCIEIMYEGNCRGTRLDFSNAGVQHEEMIVAHRRTSSSISVPWTGSRKAAAIMHLRTWWPQ
jgi:hypothetical protein